ncbi:MULTISPECIES: TetR/AcrR family transcriptional regulator [unclassified Brevundimonas]|uniref:TetR/AcrR family transcriptional regulator n=1 Tax=unclassified Brevundimonas TaxID=2622653 RepID=UPI000CFC495D|nr:MULTISPECIES: TetR/AcrR family transcriptional regulator [unclassified Brevundimonas]PRA23827.1 TetR family transcriptional regulator [Brevundimonas sp. MYb27]PQZ74385.1 TetR family transcriptional regulator [Brevundimonas sp. MYb31]PRB13983.1 TetR family transcriptional regulator [Brevundimonas sp. MYb52]PRB32506.1 TetR family transcriptional regulator [Brevundimonas sp. MYb46]PRB42242.1 TetR family transcriptional regulator [Brevundimonas sp. MYb33]
MDAQTRRRAPEATRAEIIDMAIEAAAEEGATGLKLDAVVSRLPFSKGALLHHFPTKLALLEGVIDHLASEMTAAVLAEASRDPNPYGRNARAYLRATVNDPVTDRDVSIGRAALVACAVEPSLIARWRAAMRTLAEDDPVDPAGKDDALMLRLIADGLWMSDLFGTHEVSPEQRRALLSLLTPGSILTEVQAFE